MNSSRRILVDELYRVSHAHDQAQSDRLARYRNVEPPTAELLSVLVQASRCRRVLEIGTSNGYSTLWLADAVEATGGSVVSVEIDSKRTALAGEHLQQAGLAERVELLTEDAERTLQRSADGEWEFIFLDAERPAYLGYLNELVRCLSPWGVLAVDNVISHAHELTEFTAAIEADDRLVQAVVPIGAGLRVAVRSPQAVAAEPGASRSQTSSGR